MMIHHFFYIFVGMIAILATKKIPLKKTLACMESGEPGAQKPS
jgi:hypothetical protein